MNMQIICGLMVSYISIICGVLIFIGYQINKNINKKRQLEEKRMLLELELSNSTIEMLDSMIENSMMVYRIKKFEMDPYLYINTEMQNNMTVYVLDDVIKNMSPVLYERLSLIYNKEKLEDQIYMKVSVAVMSYVIEVNGSYKE